MYNYLHIHVLKKYIYIIIKKIKKKTTRGIEDLFQEKGLYEESSKICVRSYAGES